jgi:hypothetical protein
LQRLTRHREIVANHVAVRNASDSLNECNEFPSICQVLQRTLQPIGFDGIRLQMLNPNGFSPSSFHPLRSGPDGSLLYSWSQCGVGDPPWELRLELVTNSHSRWGYMTLIRMSDGEALALDVNVLTDEFRTSLSNAVDRACTRLEASNQGHHAQRSHELAVGSSAD